MVSSECEYMGGICGSGFVSTADDVLEMSVVRWVRGVVACMKCVWSGGCLRCVVSGLGLCFLNPVGIGGVWDVCVF